MPPDNRGTLKRLTHLQPTAAHAAGGQGQPGAAGAGDSAPGQTGLACALQCKHRTQLDASPPQAGLPARAAVTDVQVGGRLLVQQLVPLPSQVGARLLAGSWCQLAQGLPPRWRPQRESVLLPLPRWRLLQACCGVAAEGQAPAEDGVDVSNNHPDKVNGD